MWPTAIEEGINHLTTLSALQQHPWALIVADEDATAGEYIFPFLFSLRGPQLTMYLPRASRQDREILQIHRTRSRRGGGYAPGA